MRTYPEASSLAKGPFAPSKQAMSNHIYVQKQEHVNLGVRVWSLFDLFGAALPGQRILFWTPKEPRRTVRAY